MAGGGSDELLFVVFDDAGGCLVSLDEPVVDGHSGRTNQDGIVACPQRAAEPELVDETTPRVTFADARRGARQADLCDNCAGNMPGKQVARRGRRPKAIAA